EPGALERPVEVVEDEARLDPDRRGLAVELAHAREPAGIVEDEGAADGLAGLAGPPAPRQDRDPLLLGDGEAGLEISLGFRADGADRLDLVDRGVGRVAAAVEAAEEDLAFDGRLEAPRQRRIADARMRRPEACRGHASPLPRPLPKLHADRVPDNLRRRSTGGQLMPASGKPA